MDLRKLVLLHSNDMHGDFFDEEIQDRLVGGLSMLSGYLQEQRKRHDELVYVISGDILQGNIIDTEYKGISSIELINLLMPDCMTIGNHEVDYGLGHLMFLERCAKFPIINANLFIKPTGTRLFNGHYVKEINGIRMLFIGICTEEVLLAGKTDPLLGTFVTIEDAAREIEIICNSYRDIDIDCTVILTHVGIEEDIKLAKLLPRELSVDLIIGGHSHTFLEQPLEENGILIAQAGVGTDFIGRFDLTINMDINRIHDFTWELVPIDDSHCPRDLQLEQVLNRYKESTDSKYNRVIARMHKTLEHGDRYRETELGNLFADIFRDMFGVNIFLLGSGSIRKEALEEIVTLGALTEIFPYPDKAYVMKITGKLFRRMLETFWDRHYKKETHEFYQLSAGTNLIYDKDAGMLRSLLFESRDIKDDDELTIGLQQFHYHNTQENFGVTLEDLSELSPIRCVCTDVRQVLMEYFMTHQNLDSNIEGRITVLD